MEGQKPINLKCKMEEVEISENISSSVLEFGSNEGYCDCGVTCKNKEDKKE